jgi:two-component system, NarL family, nitrate/nitrite response regulator NarL
MSAMTPITLLLADDHVLVREGIRSCLRRYRRIKIVGEAQDGRDAIQKAVELDPDVVLMDISMPELNGLEATRSIIENDSRCRVLILTVYENPELVRRFARSGASGYVLKNTSPSELVTAIETVHAGGVFFSPNVARTLFQQARNEAASQGGRSLSRREQQVIKLVAEGLGNKQIAERLNLAVTTIETHRKRIMRKLDVHSAAGLTRFAMANGITD